MPFTVGFLEDKECVRLEFTGSLIRDDYEGASYATGEALKQRGWARLLVDARQSKSELTPAEDYEFTSQLPSRLPLGTRVAILFAPVETEQLEFVEDVSQNRGLNLIVFLDEAQAFEWLAGE